MSAAPFRGVLPGRMLCSAMDAVTGAHTQF